MSACKRLIRAKCKHKYSSAKNFRVGIDLDHSWTPGVQGSGHCSPGIYIEKSCRLCGKIKYVEYDRNPADISRMLLKNARPDLSEYIEEHQDLISDCHWKLDSERDSDSTGRIVDDQKYWTFRARCSECKNTDWLSYKISDLIRLLNKFG